MFVVNFALLRPATLWLLDVHRPTGGAGPCCAGLGQGVALQSFGCR